MKRVLILGHTGMLGHMVSRYLSDKCVCEYITDRFPSNLFKSAVSNFDGDFIINCIGAIPQKTKDFSINYEFPIWLCNNSSVRIIHPSTDSEHEDDAYSNSKMRATNTIKVFRDKIRIIKTSIIGPEQNSHHSIFSWFLNSSENVTGYKNSLWSGITTLEWAKICYNIMNYWDSFEIENRVQSECISKYELLCTIREVYQKDINIIPFENKFIDRCGHGDIISKPIKYQLEELKEFYERV